MTCNHTEGRWEIVELYHDWESGEAVTERRYVTWSTEKDLDLHRTKCTLCGHIGYYSGAARDHYEGVNKQSWIEESNNNFLKNKNT